MASKPIANSQNKYRTITMSVVVFLVLLAVLLVGNFYLANKQAQAILRIDAVGETSDFTYDVLVAAQKLRNEQLEQKPLSIKLMKEAEEGVVGNIKIMRDGGHYEAAGRSGDVLSFSDEPKLSEQLKKVEDLWTQYQQQLKVVDQPNEDFTALEAFAVAKQEEMYRTLDELIVMLTEDSRAYSRYIGWLQIIGVVLMVSYFILFVFYFIRQMKQSDAVLEEARRETRDILDSVSEGFFLLDKDMNVGHEHSKVLNDILQQRDIGGQNFLDLVSNMLASDRKRDALKLFVTQLYNTHVVEKLIHGLNPLRRVEINDGDNDSTRTLSFHFSRVLKDKEIEKVLVSVRDMTDEARLQERLKQEQEQTNQQAEMISQLMNADYAMMAAFLKRTHETLYEINTVLKEPGTDVSQLQGKAQTIAREIHGIKGEASALKLGALVSKAEQFENKVKSLQAKSKLVGNDFLSAVIDLEGMINVVNQAQAWHNKMRPATRGAQQNEQENSFSTLPAPTSLETFLSDFVQDIAKRHNKEAVFDVRGLDYFDRHPAQLEAWKDVIIQLLRNAVVHGLETPVERSLLMKSRQGTVKLFVEQTPEGNIRLLVEDDGKGINFPQIREKAIERGMLSTEQAATWDNGQLLNLIFEPGFSTHETHDEDAGRGVGMDIVKERINQRHAKLKVRTAAKQFTRFIIDL
ncbi:ATP-binding protein [Neisseriaceae bacterium B1]